MGSDAIQRCPTRTPAEERLPVDPERIIRVGAGTKRKLWPGPDGMRVLALGGVPGKAYERPEPFKLGAADPTAA